MEPWRVPPAWAGETVVCIASGPSLTREQVRFVQGRAKTIVVNDNYLLPPDRAEVNRWADILWFCDEKWWRWHNARPELKARLDKFLGLKVTLSQAAAKADASLRWVADGGWNPAQGVSGLDARPTHVINGRNGGYQALHLAVHLGARRVVLLGYDAKVGPPSPERGSGSGPGCAEGFAAASAASGGREHWFGTHVDEAGRERPTAPAVVAKWAGNFATLVAPLKARGIEVLNATPSSAVTCFPSVRLNEVFE